MTFPTMTPSEDLLYQYEDGRGLLSETITERDKLLEELIVVAQAPMGKGTLERFPRFDVATAQTLLFQLSIEVNKIDTLIVQINWYAERCGKPLVGLAYNEE